MHVTDKEPWSFLIHAFIISFPLHVTMQNINDDTTQTVNKHMLKPISSLVFHTGVFLSFLYLIHRYKSFSYLGCTAFTHTAFFQSICLCQCCISNTDKTYKIAFVRCYGSGAGFGVCLFICVIKSASATGGNESLTALTKWSVGLIGPGGLTRSTGHTHTYTLLLS